MGCLLFVVVEKFPIAKLWVFLSYETSHWLLNILAGVVDRPVEADFPALGKSGLVALTIGKECLRFSLSAGSPSLLEVKDSLLLVRQAITALGPVSV